MSRSPLRAAVDAGFLSAARVEAAERDHGEDAARQLLDCGDLTDTQYEACRTLCGERTVAPGYDVTGVLGIGGMGVVYRAVQHALGREVALKTIGVSHSDGEAVRRFEREAKVLARVQHPNVVAAYDFGRHDGRLFLAMELAEGVDLRTAMSRRQFSEAEVWSVIRQAACGLSAACKTGVIHRDVKPANLLLTDTVLDGGVPLTKVADFGVATLVGGADDRITSTNVTVGSPAYLAPELLAGGEPSERSDVYSLGATAYHALIGVPPFHGLSLPALVAAKSTDEITVPDTISDGSRRLLLRMTARRPEKRPATFAECADLIDGLAPMASGMRPVLIDDADASTTTRILKTPPPRGRVSLLAAAAAAGLAAGGFYLTRPVDPPPVYAPADAGRLLFDGRSIGDWNVEGQWEIGENSEGTASVIGRSGSALRALPQAVVSEPDGRGRVRLLPYRVRGVLERSAEAEAAFTFRPAAAGGSGSDAVHLVLTETDWRITRGADPFASDAVADGVAAETSTVSVSVDQLPGEAVVRLNGTEVWRGTSDPRFPRAVRFSVRGGSLAVTEPSVGRLVPQGDR